MVISMTGFGKGKAAFAGGYVRVEVKTFNHKFFELSYKLPDNLQSFEEPIKKIIRKKINRGKVYLWIQYEQCEDNSLDIIVDEKRLKRYYDLLKGIKKKFNFRDEITLAQVLSFPEIIKCKPRKENEKLLWQATAKALDDSLLALMGMRQKEGAALYKDLLRRISGIERVLKKVIVYLPQEIERYKQKLKKKAGAGPDKNGLRLERIEAEVALYAKNCDISEELTRLSAHMSNFKTVLTGNKEAGKTLDFIAQEVHRETNTVGAKSTDVRISREVIFMKGEIEKIREQIQNIE